MNLDFKDLLPQLANLKASFSALGDRLSQAAVQLKDAGVLPAESLSDDLANYRRDFAFLREQAIQLAKSLPGMAVPSQLVSLKDIEGLLQTIAASEQKSGNREAALQILDRVLGIVHRDPIDYPPLQQCQAKARELRRAIANAPASDLPPEAAALLTGKHPFTGLLTLIEPPGDLDDERWGLLVEIVARAFGKPLTVAASRGKLKASAASTPVSPPVPTMTRQQPAMPVQSPIISPSPATPVPPATPQQKVSPPTAEPVPEVIVLPAWGESGSFVMPPKVGSAGIPASKVAAPEPERSILNPPPAPPAKQPDPILLPSREESEDVLAYESDRLIFGAVPSSRPQNLSKTALGSSVGLKILVHIEQIGDREFRNNEFAGSRGQALRIEGFAINIDPPIPGLGIQYMAYFQDSGDTPWVTEGEFIGTRNSGKRLEGFAIQLTGAEATQYNLFYQGHIQNVGDSPVCSSGEFCGRRGQGLRVEAMLVSIEKK